MGGGKSQYKPGKKELRGSFLEKIRFSVISKQDNGTFSLV